MNISLVMQPTIVRTEKKTLQKFQNLKNSNTMQPKKRFSVSKVWFWKFRQRYGLQGTKPIGNATSDEIIATKISLTESSHYKYQRKTKWYPAWLKLACQRAECCFNH